MAENIYSRISSYVTELFENNMQPALVYHDLGHTEEVVARTREIAAHYKLPEEDMLVLYAAAWFHDVGHLFGGIAMHENRSVEYMKVFMQQEERNDDFIDKVAKCIMATRIPHQPHSQLEEIICDADTYHFGTKDFKKTNKDVRQEYEERNHSKVSKQEWQKNTLALLEEHTFFTEYCKGMLAAEKQKNIERVRKKYLDSLTTAEVPKPVLEEKQIVDDKHKRTLVSRGIQTMLRLTSENHLELSNMADGKANILISVNSIIISVILSVLLRKLEADKHLTIPTIIFLVFSVSTVVLAILATRPKISEGTFSREDIAKKKTNLLFFGNFYRSSLEEYKWGMGIMMKDKDYLYGSLIQDIHDLGVVLGRKYKLIRIAYNVFMVGIVVSVIAFGLAVILHDPAETVIITRPANSPL